MSKSAALQAALAAGTAPAAKPAPTTAPAEDMAREQSGRQPSRTGKWNLSAWIDPRYKRSLMMVRLKEDRTAQALICEAMNLLFERYNVPVIGEDASD
jgi:hypothetical protein